MEHATTLAAVVVTIQMMRFQRNDGVSMSVVEQAGMRARNLLKVDAT